MNLFELNQNYEELSRRDDLDPAILRDTLDAINDAREIKFENIANWIDNLQMESNAMKEKIAEWQKEKRYRDNKVEWLRAYLTDAMDQMGINNLNTGNHIFKVRNYRARTIVDDETKVPGDYIKKETVYKVDKKSLYDSLKAGEKVPGAHLEENRKAMIK